MEAGGARITGASHAVPGTSQVRGRVPRMWRCWGHRLYCQPASHPILLAGKVLSRAAGGHWLGMESQAGPVLARLSGALPGAQ